MFLQHLSKNPPKESVHFAKILRDTKKTMLEKKHWCPPKRKQTKTFLLLFMYLGQLCRDYLRL